jgi:hypothetical protein
MTKLTCIIGLSVLAFAALGAQGAPSLEGVWQVDQIVGTGGTNSRPEPAIFVFTKRHYSVVQVTAPRADLPTPINGATAAELVAALGPSFNAQAGTYSVSGHALDMTPVVAKSPNVMRAAAAAGWTFALKDGYLYLTPPGPVGTYRLKRIE